MTATSMSTSEARRYSTARFSPKTLHNQPGLPTGPVRIAFLSEAFNQHLGRREFVFRCFNIEDGSPSSPYFQSALVEFAE